MPHTRLLVNSTSRKGSEAQRDHRRQTLQQEQEQGSYGRVIPAHHACFDSVQVGAGPIRGAVVVVVLLKQMPIN